ncbi:DUF3667 domain-containing protein [Hymenobacter saemangeumensis]
MKSTSLSNTGVAVNPACASCSTLLAGEFCHVCGEKQLHRHDYKLAHFVEHAVDILSHFDLRVLRDLWAQARRPGWLAAEWLQGRRVKHAPPVQLFLITNLLFYLLASVSHFSPFETKLQFHLSNQLYGPWAQRLVEQYLTGSGTSPDTFAERFANSAHIYSKSLVFLFVPLLAVPLWALFWRQRRYFVEWLSLSLYLFGGILLVFAAVSLLSLTAKLLPGTGWTLDDVLVTNLMFALCTTYACLFFRRVFPERWALLRWAKGILYTLAFLLVLVYIYRFILFVVCYCINT